MPSAAPRPCTHPGCGVLVRGSSRCERHVVAAGSFADKRRGTRHERGYGSAWVRLRERVLARDNGLCQPCATDGRTTPAVAVDHIRAKAHGGTDDEANLQAICSACHRAKTQREAQGLGGDAKSSAHAQGTEPQVKFLRAQVSGVGGGQVVREEGA